MDRWIQGRQQSANGDILAGQKEILGIPRLIRWREVFGNVEERGIIMTCPKKNCIWQCPGGFMPFQRCVCKDGWLSDIQKAQEEPEITFEFTPDDDLPFAYLTGFCDNCNGEINIDEKTLRENAGNIMICPHCGHEMEV